MCKIEGCDAKAVAKGLCAKHYMRERRTGDANRTLKRGPKTSQMNKFIRARFPQCAPRTQALIRDAMRDLESAAYSLKEDINELFNECLKDATREDGTINIAGFKRQATFHYYLGVQASARRIAEKVR